MAAVRPGTRVDLAKADPGATHGHTRESAAEELEKAAQSKPPPPPPPKADTAAVAALEARVRVGPFGIVPFVDGGNISTSPLPKFDNLRFGAGYVTPTPATYFDYSAYGGLGGAVAVARLTAPSVDS